MSEDGNCLFRAVADQVYGDSEAYGLARQMCINYMVNFSLFFFFFKEKNDIFVVREKEEIKYVNFKNI